MQKNGVSIIICCCNSADIIAETLEYLLRQKVDENLHWEVIVVDNASTDNTIGKANEAWNRNLAEASFRIVKQPIAGKTNALKKGLEVAHYEFILICDDDNFLKENYVQTAYDIMKSNPKVGFLGGCGCAKTDGNVPDWFDKFKSYYGCGSQSKNGPDITHEKEYVYGAGSVFRKSIFEGLDEDIYFRPLPGRKNANLVGAEDNIMGYVAVIKGFRIWYSEKLKFYHKIKPSRLKWQYLLNLSYSNGRAEIYLDPYTDFIRDNENPASWSKKVITNIKHVLSLIKKNGVNLFRKSEGNYSQLKFYYYYGKLTELLKLNFSYQKEYQKSIGYCKAVEKAKRKNSEAQRL